MVSQEASPVTAVLADAVSGSRQEMRFISSGSDRILTATHVPASKPVARVLVCNSFGHPFAQNYRREVLIARQLAADGFLVMRFNYRGTGESTGSPLNLTTQTMIEDAENALAELDNAAPGTPLFVIGTHWGAYVAAQVASERPNAGLILWDPVLDGSSVARQMFRSVWASVTHESTNAGLSRTQLVEKLAAESSLDVLGYHYSDRFHQDAATRLIGDLRFKAPAEILVIGFKKRGELSAGLQGLNTSFENSGHTVKLVHVRTNETWWINDSGEHVLEEDNEFTRQAIDNSVSWLKARLDSPERAI